MLDIKFSRFNFRKVQDVIDDIQQVFTIAVDRVDGFEVREIGAVATLCVEAQERREVSELQYSDRED